MRLLFSASEYENMWLRRTCFVLLENQVLILVQEQVLRRLVQGKRHRVCSRCAQGRNVSSKKVVSDARVLELRKRKLS